jgi:hypothetical protein
MLSKLSNFSIIFADILIGISSALDDGLGWTQIAVRAVQKIIENPFYH